MFDAQQQFHDLKVNPKVLDPAISSTAYVQPIHHDIWILSSQNITKQHAHHLPTENATGDDLKERHGPKLQLFIGH